MKSNIIWLILFSGIIFGAILLVPLQPRLPEVISKFLLTDDTQLPKEATEKTVQKIPILMYHYIRNPHQLPDSDSTGRKLSVSPETLNKHLQLLAASNIKTIRLVDLIATEITTPSVVLTFDDGYRDFYQNAWPILKKNNARATVFVIGDKIDRPGYLRSRQLQELAVANIEIASHSLSHPNLTNLNRQQILEQLTKSKDKIESIIGRKIYSFAYPSGQFNDQVKILTKKAGYQVAVTTQQGIADLGQDEMIALPRLRVYDKTDLVKLLDR